MKETTIHLAAHRRRLLLLVLILFLASLTTPVRSANLITPPPRDCDQIGLINHPVILVHGFTGQYDEWDDQTIYKVLNEQCYNMEMVTRFEYPPPLGQSDGEDSTGDIVRIAGKLATDIDDLIQRSRLQGGPAYVDIIAHSMGGLITRQYLGEHPTNHRVRKFIELGVPNTGVYLLAWNNNLVMKGVVAAIDTVWEKVNGERNAWLALRDTVAVQQFTPGSDFLTQLNRPGQSPSDVDYYCFYGDMILYIQVEMFDLEVRSGEIEIGDGGVRVDSATTIPNLPPGKQMQCQGYTSWVKVALGMDEYALDPDYIWVGAIAEIGANFDSANHTGLKTSPRVQGDVFAVLDDGISAPPGGIQPPPGGAAASATVLVLDVSGSMSDEWRGGVKIESAKQAAQDVINMIEQESQIGYSSHQVALATFSSGAYLDLALTANYETARNAVQALEPLDGTNLGAGLQAANQALASAPADAQKIILLLSDGLTNEGLPPQGILDGPAQAAANAGVCIYTVGFGEPGDLDEDLLRQISQRAGCGVYTYADAPAELEQVYVRLRHQSLGQIIGEFEGQIAQGETVEVGQVQVPANQGELYVSLHWPGSTLDLVVTDPAGRRIDEHSLGVSLSRYERLIYLIVQNPRAGAWSLQAVGIEVPEGVLPYDAIVSVRERIGQPAAQNGGWLVALLVLAVIGGGAAALAFAARTAAPRYAPAGLQVVQGQAARPSAGLRRGQLTIGRDRRCEMRLYDPRVSARHAVIQHTPAGYVLSDLNSTNGTFVNGQRVSQATLRGGERLQVGHTELLFTLPATPLASRLSPSATLAVMAGQQEHARYPVPSGAILGGRSASPVPLGSDAQVSRQHARLDYYNGQWLLTDLNSTNGVYVNGRQVRQQVLRAGDEIRMGNTVLRFLG